MKTPALKAHYGPKLKAAKTPSAAKAVVAAATIDAFVLGVKSAASKSASTAKAISDTGSNLDLGAPLGDSIGFGETAAAAGVDGGTSTPAALQALLDGIPDDPSAANLTSVGAYASEAGAQEAFQAGGVTSLDVVPDGDECEVCQGYVEGGPYDADDDDNLPSYHAGCGCSTEPADTSDNALDRALARLGAQSRG
jgi:hypothetical protein